MTTHEIINGNGHKIAWDLTCPLEVLDSIREGLFEAVAEGYDEASDRFLATATVMHGEIVDIKNVEEAECNS